MTESKASVDRIVNRLRGQYRVDVNDGLGPLNGKPFFERDFPTTPIQSTAADVIQRMSEWFMSNPCPPELHDLAAKCLGEPSLCHGFCEFD